MLHKRSRQLLERAHLQQVGQGELPVLDQLAAVPEDQTCRAHRQHLSAAEPDSDDTDTDTQAMQRSRPPHGNAAQLCLSIICALASNTLHPEPKSLSPNALKLCNMLNRFLGQHLGRRFRSHHNSSRSIHPKLEGPTPQMLCPRGAKTSLCTNASP